MDPNGTKNVHRQQANQYAQQANQNTSQTVIFFQSFSETKPQENFGPREYGDAKVQEKRAYYQFHRYV